MMRQVTPLRLEQQAGKGNEGEEEKTDTYLDHRLFRSPAAGVSRRRVGGGASVGNLGRSEVALDEIGFGCHSQSSSEANECT